MKWFPVIGFLVLAIAGLYLREWDVVVISLLAAGLLVGLAAAGAEKD